MKKNILLIFTFIISFILLIDNAYAAESFACIYEQYSCTTVTMSSYTHKFQKKITQSPDGEIRFYMLKNEGANQNVYGGIGEKFNTVTPPTISYNKTKAYDKSSKTLTKCPPCVEYKEDSSCTAGTISDDFVFSDYKNEEKEKCPTGYKKLKEQTTYESEFEAGCRNITKEEAKKDIKNTNYTNICEYIYTYANDNNAKYSAKVYFNKEKYTVVGNYDSMHSCIKVSELNQANGGKCPEKIYSSYDGSKLFITSEAGNIYPMLLASSNAPKNEEDTNAIVNNCSDLFGEDLIEEINKVMDIIRIAVPILLIVFGIVDFFKATFDNSEDEMKKDRDRFIKRIIAAIIVFLVPFFVNLVLDVANTVWSDINTDTCISTNE